MSGTPKNVATPHSIYPPNMFVGSDSLLLTNQFVELLENDGPPGTLLGLNNISEPSRNFQIQVLNGIRAGYHFPVSSRPIIMGRGLDSDVTIPDLTLSRHHAKVFVKDGNVYIADVGSSNGTFIGSTRLVRNKPARVPLATVITVGSVHIIAQYTLDNPQGTLRVRRDSADSASSTGSIKPTPRLSARGERRLSLTDEQRIRADIVTAGRRLNAVLRVSEILGLRSFSEDLAEEVIIDVLDVLLNLFTNAKQVMLLRGRSERSLRFISARRRAEDPDSLLDVDGEDTAQFESTSEFHIPRALLTSAFQRARVLALPPRSRNDDLGHRALGHDPDSLPALLCIPLLVRAPSGRNTNSLHNTLYGPAGLTTPRGKGGHDFLGMVFVEGISSFQFTKKDMEIATAVGHQLSVALKSQQLVWEATTNANIRRSLTKYLPQPLVDQVMKGKKDLVPQGVQGTVLFSDIVGFTALSESMPPTELIEVMNRYFSDAVPCISFENGTIDKFIGDAIMALFGISHFIQHGVFDAESPLRAIRSALSMQNRVFGFQHASLIHPLRLGIGIHTGPMVAGNIGAADRMEYTVLGDVVNTTQRIESTAMASSILISEETYRVALDAMAARHADPAPLFAVTRMPPVRVKNKTHPISLLSIRGLFDRDNLSMLLSIPGSIDSIPVLITRRVGVENTFVLAHSACCRVGPGPLHLCLPEIDLPPVEITRVVRTLACEADHTDCPCAQMSTMVSLSDPTLSGLIDRAEPMQCVKPWSEMPRNPLVDS
ncbi:Adenylate and Guanylate cyclase catalytic domain [Carpediemonas membranifera]|uniref:Adenylate and Guanylate cyclase catalytic domain n=1 Tax=Carpediemonas membranifera TaxID=201153 RepID=A0A8J6AT08_9EUKA|nr:Adenylate and Guanylate cyclase catalytic domain [Carpediemonas membranifera]|eukprot:KAG9393343.1 Adenylate and Guanylate cyclase catalytic domain [Carpediemonas membranifera]